MSIFDRFVSKSTDEQETRSFSPTPYRKLFSELDEAGEEAKAQYPDDSKTVEDFVRFLKETCRARRKKMPVGNSQPINAEARFFLSQDRMSAYACLLPPENRGAGITLEEFLEDLHYEGIQYGVDREKIQQELAQGYFHIFPAARGTPPRAGEDGKVRELFQRNGVMCLEVQDEAQADFIKDIQLQPIRKGAVICLIQPARPGTDGVDVTGQKLPCPQVMEARLPQGKNTTVSRGGLALTAEVDGLLYIENDQFCIHEQKIIEGDLDQIQGKLEILGNLYIGGNVDGGVEIEASGDIIIQGKVGQARITSIGGTIRVQQGIYGTQDQTVLRAARQVQTPVMERAEVNAGTSVVAEMISNSTICCDGTVHAMTGRGMIVGSLVRAGDSILCLRVGNLAGDRSKFSVGYPPNSPESWNQTKTELEEVQSTLKKLWATIAELRKKSSRISDMEKSILDQLVVQRDLYDARRETLTAELNALDKILAQKSKGKIQCEKLLPCLEVQIGRVKEEITTEEENCNIHVVENRIFLK